jgi:hypothetical protein
MLRPDSPVEPSPSDSGVSALSLLGKASHVDIVHQPFPHLVVRNALDVELADRLLTEIPPVSTLARGQAFGSNVRITYPHRLWNEDPSVSPTWKRFLNEHLSQTFLDGMMSLFGSALKRLHPRFEARCGRLDRLRAGLRCDQFDRADVILDAQICANTPVLDKASSVRGVHVDSPRKLFTGLYYLRHPADTSNGGDLQLYGPRRGSSLRWLGRVTSTDHFDLCRTVRYEHNTLVLFLNSIDSVHLVTPRSPTPYPRLLVNLVGEVQAPIWRFQESPYRRFEQWLLWRARGRGRTRRSTTVVPWTAEDARSLA